ncbi:MAG: NADPH:quinone oxidoreductase family protein [Amaricoccus sp.]|uniref:NADPH:quinone oxidoreductase family protein n=1 Tax=Amaricoccus sp. TaxID=1872485 RepID=UPI0039E62E95
MRAMQVTALGTPLVQRVAPVPVPGAGEVLVRVRACGLNFADTLMVAGTYQVRPPLPFSPGVEVAGVVEAPGGARLAAGTRVAAYVGHGGLAEYVAVPEARCAVIPDGMPDSVAAGFLVAYGTSHIALAWAAKLRPGETLLVLGASGGVGLTAVELGARMGARVVAVARGPERLRIAGRAGAAVLLDADADIRAEVKALGGADVVYDPVGGTLAEAALRATRARARILPIGFASGGVPQYPANLLLVKDLSVFGVHFGAWAEHSPGAVAASFETLFAWWRLGRLAPHVSHRLPLSGAEAGLDLLRRREATGKVVVEIGG